MAETGDNRDEGLVGAARAEGPRWRRSSSSTVEVRHHADAEPGSGSHGVEGSGGQEGIEGIDCEGGEGDEGGDDGDDGVSGGAESFLVSLAHARIRLLQEPAETHAEVHWVWDLAAQVLEVHSGGDARGGGAVRRSDPAELILAIHESDRARVVSALHALVDGRLERTEVRHRTREASGGTIAMLTRATAVCDGRGRVRWVAGLTRNLDVQARRDAQRLAHLRRLEAIAGVSRAVMRAGLSLPEILDEVARAIADLVGGGCAVRLLSEDRRLLEAPAALAHIDGERRIALLESLGRPQSALAGVLAHVIESGSPAQLHGEELVRRFARDDDVDVPGVAALVPLRTVDETIGVLVVGRDAGIRFDREDLQVLVELSDVAGRAIGNARLYARAERLLRVTETFVGVLGHDLRNPLGAITTCAHLVQRSDDPEGHRRAAARIERSAARMARMIEQLLDFTRMRVGRLSLERAATDGADICRDVIDELREVHARRAVTLRVVGDPRGHWDPDRLSQLVSNLVGNALVHGDPDAGVDVLVDGVLRDVVRIDVHSGGAIPQAQLQTIFEPMGSRAAVGDGRAARRHGLGLGLFIVRQIALAHGGDSTVTSSAAAGTTFSVTLPRCEHRERRGPA